MPRQRAGFRAGLAACLLALGALIAAPGIAPASPVPFAQAAVSLAAASQESAPIPPGFKLRASNGYTIEVAILRTSVDSPRAYAQILVRGRTGFVSYFAPATATEGSFEVDLGELGHVAVAFHATGGTQRQSVPCGRKQQASFASGYYEGTIVFHGEEGYTEIEARQGMADASFLLGLVCPAKSTSGTGPGLPGAELRVRARNRTASPSLIVVKNHQRAIVQLEVNTSERRGEIAINRTVRMRASRKAFGYAPNLLTARIEPPAPFSGRAFLLHLDRHTNLWNGSLAVNLPGQSDVQLTGSQFRASIFHARFKGSGPLG